MSDTDVVTINTADGQDFQVEVKVARMSVTLKDLIEDAGIANAVPVPNVDGQTFQKVIEYCKYHTENPTPIPESPLEKRTDDISDWDQKFCNVEQDVLFQLILASNYLDVAPLLDVCCKTVANSIKGKKPEEIRKQFNIKNDFTPEEEAVVLKENEWCEEK